MEFEVGAYRGEPLHVKLFHYSLSVTHAAAHIYFHPSSTLTITLAPAVL